MTIEKPGSFPSAEYHEIGKDNEYEFPREYFDAQVAFAIKWSDLTGEDLAMALAQKTPAEKRVGESAWKECVEALSSANSRDAITDMLYAAYTQSQTPILQEAPAEIGKIIGAQYLPETQTIKVHFHSQPHGAPNVFGDEYLTARRESALRAVQAAYEAHPEAVRVVGGSWLYNLTAYRESFPSIFTEDLRRLVPPELTKAVPNSVGGMSFKGNSLWGQFINRHGWVRADRYADFMSAVDGARTTDDLIEAFPLQPLLASSTVQEFLYLED